MSEEASPPLGEPTTIISSGETGPQTFNDAVRNIAKAREAAYAPPKEEESPPPVEATPPPAEEKDAAPPETEAPSDTTQEAEPAEELPPIEPPRSWSTEDKEEFATYPRDAQEKISRREQERDAEVRRGQNKQADERKALEAEREQTAKVRQQYEQTLPNLLANINAQVAGEFADIGTPNTNPNYWAALEKMQAEDFVRFQRYQLVQQKAQAARQELTNVQARQAADTEQRWNDFAKAEDAKFTELVPEAADPVKAKTLQERAGRLLTNIGFSREAIDAAWQGKTGISMRDHQVQLLIYKAMRFDEAEAKAKTVRQTPLPQVVKPGTARNTKADADASKIESLQKQQLTAKGNKAIDIGTEIIRLKRAAGKL